MKVSELISRLSEFQDKIGDVDVVVDSGQFYSGIRVETHKAMLVAENTWSDSFISRDRLKTLIRIW